jgi:hypothetical protein
MMSWLLPERDSRRESSMERGDMTMKEKGKGTLGGLGTEGDGRRGLHDHSMNACKCNDVENGRGGRLRESPWSSTACNEHQEDMLVVLLRALICKGGAYAYLS